MNRHHYYSVKSYDFRNCSYIAYIKLHNLNYLYVGYVVNLYHNERPDLFMSRTMKAFMNYELLLFLLNRYTTYTTFKISIHNIKYYKYN